MAAADAAIEASRAAAVPASRVGKVPARAASKVSGAQHPATRTARASVGYWTRQADSRAW